MIADTFDQHGWTPVAASSLGLAFSQLVIADLAATPPLSPQRHRDTEVSFEIKYRRPIKQISTSVPLCLCGESTGSQQQTQAHPRSHQRQFQLHGLSLTQQRYRYYYDGISKISYETKKPAISQANKIFVPKCLDGESIGGYQLTLALPNSLPRQFQFLPRDRCYHCFCYATNNKIPSDTKQPAASQTKKISVPPGLCGELTGGHQQTSAPPTSHSRLLKAYRLSSGNQKKRRPTPHVRSDQNTTQVQA